MFPKFVVGDRIGEIGANRAGEGFSGYVDISRRNALQGLADDMISCDRGAEKPCCYTGNSVSPIKVATIGHHCCRCANCEDVRIELFTDSSDQQRDVGALPPAICMKLVKDEKAHAVRGSNYRPVGVILPGQDEFQHHVVGKENVWWTSGQIVPL